MIKDNQGLIWSIVKRFTGRNYETEDLYQIGCMGFIKAIKRFDTSFEVQISTYAVPYILGEIKKFIRDDGIIKLRLFITWFKAILLIILSSWFVSTGIFDSNSLLSLLSLFSSWYIDSTGLCASMANIISSLSTFSSLDICAMKLEKC